MREKVGKSRFTVFFRWFVAPEGRKVGSLKRRVRRHLVRWEMKNCTPLWREAHFEVKMCSFGALLEVEMSKKCTPLWRKARLEVKSVKNWRSRTTFGSWDVEKVHALVYNYTTHYGILRCTPLQVCYTTLNYTTQPYTNYNTLHYTPLHCTQLHYTTTYYNHKCNYNYGT